MGTTKDAINRTIGKINKSPFIFNTETGIQGLLYSELIKEYNEERPFNLNGNQYFTNHVHLEYFAGDGGRIDAVVFKDEEIAKIDRPWLCIAIPDNPKYRPVELSDAIEIKIVGGKGEENLFTSIKQDVERLARLLKANKAQYAHFLLIIRWPTKRKNIIDRMEKAEVLARDLCNVKGVQFYCNSYRDLFLI